MPVTNLDKEVIKMGRTSETSNETQLMRKTVQKDLSPAPVKVSGGVSYEWKRVQVSVPLSRQEAEVPDAEVTALLSEEALSRIWDTPEEDEAWQHLQKGM